MIGPQCVRITNERLALDGILGFPADARSIILFAHGSGSGRLSPRNTAVAGHLQDRGMATLLLDLLTADEWRDRQKVFDIDLLADRLLIAKRWVEQQPSAKGLAIGYFGASTGAGAAIQAAAREPSNVYAVVSRGGRPDLAESYLAAVTAPTLLIVGGNDTPVIEMNQRAYNLMTCEKSMIIVPGATHLFDEPGTLEQVADQACRWFIRHLKADN